MIYNAFPYQFAIELSSKAGEIPLTNYLKDLNKKGDLPDFNKLGDFFSSELQNTSLQTPESANFFFFVVRNSLLYHFYREDQKGFDASIEIIRHRFMAFKNLNLTGIALPSWEQFLDLAKISFSRLLRQIPSEEFEEHLNGIDWSLFPAPFTSWVSTILGYVYLAEDREEDKVGKARIWLQKALKEESFEGNLINQIFYIHSLFLERNANNAERIKSIIDNIKEEASHKESFSLRKMFNSACFELEANLLANIFENFDDEVTKLEYCQQELRNMKAHYRERDQQNLLPTFAKASLQKTIAELYSQLYVMVREKNGESSSFSKHTMQHIAQALELAEENKDQYSYKLFHLLQTQLGILVNASVTEKDAKENISAFKKSGNYPRYIEAAKAYTKVQERQDDSVKSFDLVLEILKLGNKRIEEGGFYLLVKGFELANDVFLVETIKPGVSWMVGSLDKFMVKITNIIDKIEENFSYIRKDLVDDFREQYLRFEPASHFNIKVYYLFQLYEIKMLRIGAVMSGDALGIKLADKLLGGLLNKNNALSFIASDWEDFKKVPNFVRNSTLNKCINISKGDLPLAAEHLDFSYRNLRSYITFKEVNRLGFFLDLHETENKQLEQGIRFMFYDLYKKGTIFEVVFDMPKFLVSHSKTGFYSQDLEKELNIKGTTAKKYIKIMIEEGMIRQDKTTGRKHFYLVVRDQIMNRLGKQQAALLNS